MGWGIEGVLLHCFGMIINGFKNSEDICILFLGRHLRSVFRKEVIDFWLSKIDIIFREYSNDSLPMGYRVSTTDPWVAWFV